MTKQLSQITNGIGYSMSETDQKKIYAEFEAAASELQLNTMNEEKPVFLNFLEILDRTQRTLPVKNVTHSIKVLIATAGCAAEMTGRNLFGPDSADEEARRMKMETILLKSFRETVVQAQIMETIKNIEETQKTGNEKTSLFRPSLYGKIAGAITTRRAEFKMEGPR